MEKISGILGSSPRLKSADVQASPPIRPGMPSFGRPIGEVALAHRKDLSTAEKANMIREQMIEDKKHLREQEIAENMAGKFFMNKMEDQHGSIELHPEASAPASMSMPAPEELQPEDMRYMPKGSYLDRNA